MTKCPECKKAIKLVDAIPDRAVFYCDYCEMRFTARGLIQQPEVRKIRAWDADAVVSFCMGVCVLICFVVFVIGVIIRG